MGNEAPQITIERIEEPAYCQEINTEEVVEQPWFHEINRYLQTREYPEGASVNDKKFLRKFAAKFFLSNGVLYKRSHDCVLLRCVDKAEAELIMTEIHSGTFGTHLSGHTMAKKILRAGYYWSTMEADCYKFAKKIGRAHV